MGPPGRRTVAVAGSRRVADLADRRAFRVVIQLRHAANRRVGVTVQRRSLGDWKSTGIQRQ
jgi:hypothetical protein